MSPADGDRPWTITADGLILTLRLTPRGGRDALEGVDVLADGRTVLKARVRAAPSDGAANAALVALIAKTLRIAPRQVVLIAGESARIKRVRISGAGADLASSLAALLPPGARRLPLS
ncbi:MAG: DUF167 family protein [Xanthobacteraceae bacterium]